MFCSLCGTQMQPNETICRNCGRRVGDPVSAIAQSRLQGHLQTLSVLWIILGALFVIPALGFMAFGEGLHLVIHHEEPFSAFIPLAIYLFASSLLVIGAGGICVGVGLRQRLPWARTAAIILGVLSLFHPPLGTALGIYTLWVLLADESGAEYRYLGQAG